MRKETKILTYTKGKVCIKMTISGEYPIPSNQEEYWVDTTNICNIPEEAGRYYITGNRPKKIGRYPKEVNGYLYLRELAPNPSADEIMYTEDDINRTYFSKYYKQEEISEKAPCEKLSEDADNESHTAPEQISVTWNGDNKEIAFVKKMFSFMPDIISSKIIMFEKAVDVLKLEDAALIKRIMKTVPKDVLEKYENNTLVLYLGNDDRFDSFTLDITAVGLREFINSSSIFEEICIQSNWDELRTLLEEINETLEQFEIWVLDTFTDIRMYNKNIDLVELIKRYDNIGTLYIQHNNGRAIFDNFLLDNDFKRIQVKINEDIYTGYYSNHVLFIKDYDMNYLRVYVFDVLLEEDDILENAYNDLDHMTKFATNIAFSDTIIDDIRECMFYMYGQAFIKYITPCIEEDTSRDV